MSDSQNPHPVWRRERCELCKRGLPMSANPHYHFDGHYHFGNEMLCRCPASSADEIIAELQQDRARLLAIRGCYCEISRLRRIEAAGSEDSIKARSGLIKERYRLSVLITASDPRCVEAASSWKQEDIPWREHPEAATREVIDAVLERGAAMSQAESGTTE